MGDVQISVCQNNGMLPVLGILDIHTDDNACNCTWVLHKDC